MTHLTSTINGQLIGSFRYSYSDLINSSVGIEEVIVLAWGNEALIPGTPRYEWGQRLKEVVQNNPDTELRLLIDEIRLSTGRDPATSGTPLLVDDVLQKYYVLTPKRFTEFDDGTIVNKIRLVSILPLRDSQVREFEIKGSDIEPIGVWASIQDFVDKFPDPIALVSSPKTIINGQPVTIFPDGKTSQENQGGQFVVFVSRPLSELEVNNPTDINGTEISIPIADNIINNLGGSPNNGTPTGQTFNPPEDNRKLIVPIGVLLLATGAIG